MVPRLAELVTAPLVQEPDRRRAGAAIAPEQIGGTVAVEIAGTDNDPGAGHRAEIVSLGNREPVHVPDHHGAVAAVAPENVTLASVPRR